MYIKRIVILYVFIIILLLNSVVYAAPYQRRFKVGVSIQSLGGIIRDAYEGVVEIIYILPEGAEPHSYQVTPDVIQSLGDVDIFVFTGHFSFEYKILESYPNKPHITLDIEDKTYNGYKVHLLKYPSGEGYNPHGYWLYPDNAYLIAKAFRDILVELDPSNIEYYNRLLNEFKMRIEELKDLYREVSIKYNLNSSLILIGFPAEEYIVEPFNASIVGVIIKGPGQIITPEETNKIVSILSKSPNKYIISSDIASKMGVFKLLNDISRMSESKVIYVNVVGAGFDSYIELMYFNLGMIVGGIESNPYILSDGSGGGLNIILLTFVVLLIIVVIVEAVYIYLLSRVY